jgi:hypothetical protein
MLKDLVTTALYTNGDYWVRRAKHGYEVFKDGITHSTRCAIIGYDGDKGFSRAKEEADRRASFGDVFTAKGKVNNPVIQAFFEREEELAEANDNVRPTS